jgi:hypothetical protein
MSRLKTTERNSIIEDYRQGIVNARYEVIPSKRTKGKYTVTPRPRPLTDSEVAAIGGRDRSLENTSLAQISALGSGQGVPTSKDAKKIKHEIDTKLYSNISELQNQLNAQMMMRLNEINSKLERIKEKKRAKKTLKKQPVIEEEEDRYEDCVRSTPGEEELEPQTKTMDRKPQKAKGQKVVDVDRGSELRTPQESRNDQEYTAQGLNREPTYTQGLGHDVTYMQVLDEYNDAAYTQGLGHDVTYREAPRVQASRRDVIDYSRFGF